MDEVEAAREEVGHSYRERRRSTLGPF